MPFRKRATDKAAGAARIAELRKKYPEAWAEGERRARDVFRTQPDDIAKVRQMYDDLVKTAVQHGVEIEEAKRLGEKAVEDYASATSLAAIPAFKEAVEAGKIDLGGRWRTETLTAFGLSMGFTLKELINRELT